MKIFKMCYKCFFKNYDNVLSGYIILGYVLEFYIWIFFIKLFNNLIFKYLKYFYVFVLDCKFNFGNLVLKFVLYVIYRIYLISNYILCIV